MTKVLNWRNAIRSQFAAGSARILRDTVAYVFVWSCFVKLPATSLRDSPPQEWEGVLSYAAAHQLQWGRDIIYTFGPLGFLTSDYYWGNFFWPIVIWAGAFALIVSTALVPLMSKLPGIIRLALYVALPLLTVPSCLDLGFDPIHLLSITILGIVSLPSERPGALRVITTGVVFSVLSLVKFTFCIYSIYVLIIVAASNRSTSWRNTAILAASSLLSLLTLYGLSGQSIFNFIPYLARSAQVAGGYSAAMGLPATGHDLTLGIALAILLAALVFTIWFGSSNWPGRINRVAIVAAGIFLAWKEGFVRTDMHVMVFFVYSFLVSALLPALLGIDFRKKSQSNADGAVRAESITNPLIAQRIVTLSGGCIFLSLAALVLYHKAFTSAVRNGLVARNKDTVTAFFRPAAFKVALERHLDTMRQQCDLPEMRALVGRETVGAMNLNQGIAILNGFNYRPHPVFQNYCAYTPDLQRINAEFFRSDKAPEYLLWHTGSIDGRFPTLDDGEMLLIVLRNYSPAIQENGLILWKRIKPEESSYSLGNKRENCGSLEQWIPIPAEPTWVQIECKQTVLGAIQSLLFRGSELRLEIELANGEKRSYRLLPGNARYGFVISPFLRADFQLLESAIASQNRSPDATVSPAISGGPFGIIAARVCPANQFAFKVPVRFVTQTIHGVWPVPAESLPDQSKEISKAQ